MLLLTLLGATTLVVADNEVVSIWAVTGPWSIEFGPNGRATAQYGSLPGDAGYVDEGTVDFKALLATLETIRKKEQRGPVDGIQVGIRRKGETSSTAIMSIDDRFIREVLTSIDSKWKQIPGGERFDELKAKHPIIRSKE